MPNDVKDFPAVWPSYEAFYIESMLFNARAALVAVEDVSRVVSALESSQVALESVDQHALLDSLQSIIVHAAALSRYFWPSRSKPKDWSRGPIHSERAEHLRKVLRIREGNPLEARSLRDSLEHFDERLDVHLSEGIAGHIIPAYVGPDGEDSGVPVHVFRAFYINTGMFEVLGKRYEIQPIVDEIYRIYEILETCSQRGRLPEVQSSRDDEEV